MVARCCTGECGSGCPRSGVGGWISLECLEWVGVGKLYIYNYIYIYILNYINIYIYIYNIHISQYNYISWLGWLFDFLVSTNVSRFRDFTRTMAVPSSHHVTRWKPQCISCCGSVAFKKPPSWRRIAGRRLSFSAFGTAGKTWRFKYQTMRIYYEDLLWFTDIEIWRWDLSQDHMWCFCSEHLFAVEMTSWGFVSRGKLHIPVINH